MHPPPAAKVKQILYVTYLIVALDVTWLFLQFSITPYLAKRLGFDTLWFGYLQTTVGVIQLLGGPLFGRFADIFGARAALSLSCLASVIYFLLLAAADSPLLLFLHKLPAVFMHALPAGSVFNLVEIVRLMKFPGVAKTFTVKIIAGLPSGVFQVMFSIIVMNFFQLQAEQNGYLMAYLGVLQMVIQGGVIGRLTTRYSENSLLLFSIGLNSLVGLAQALTTNMLQFCFVLIPMMLALSIFNVITDSMLTKSVPSSDTGTMLGLCASVLPLVRTIGPTIGGFLYETYGVTSLGYIQFTVSAITFSLLFMSSTRGSNQPKMNLG
ncbi:Solute carrier family 22 member 18 [Bagarius yarrelli]|uniref:Solute carrier family 22 member 18 n=1 Tax=Bagarius yarrelli TaxID=175774 RepID=A0A556V7E3_BAGYA|nr:Solute carrier family 22 member 18 [Bagarius yarrelli]